MAGGRDFSELHRRPIIRFCDLISFGSPGHFAKNVSTFAKLIRAQA